MRQWQVRDKRCDGCDRVYEDVACQANENVPCPACGGPTYTTWEKGHGPSLDCFGTPQYSDASGQYHSSNWEKRKYMARQGYTEAGDTVGGARADHRLRGFAMSAPGVSRRTSTAEREIARARASRNREGTA